MMLMVEFDKELQESNDRFKISVKDMFPNLWGLGSDKLRKLSVLLLDVEKNPFFLMDYDMKIVQLSDRLGIRPEETKKHYDSLKPSGQFHSVTKEYVEKQNLLEYRLYFSLEKQARILADVIDATPIEELQDSESKAFERSINWGKQFKDFYANYDVAKERIEKVLKSDLHEDVLKNVVGAGQSPQTRSDMLKKSLKTGS